MNDPKRDALHRVSWQAQVLDRARLTFEGADLLMEWFIEDAQRYGAEDSEIESAIKAPVETIVSVPASGGLSRWTSGVEIHVT
jgi:hypothetical protein